MTTQMNELGFYTLAGAPKSPRELIDEVAIGEQLGLGSMFISERFNIKEAATLCGAAGAVSTNLGIATAATNHNTRHPMITAAFAMTMHKLTNGRFSLGLGRGFDPLFDAYGLPRIKSAQIEDFVGLMRRIWKGELIMNHDGPAGKYPILSMGSEYNEHIPMTFTAIGPKSQELGGRVFDAVVLHTFLSDETTARAVKIIKDAAEKAGRDPAAVKVWSCYAVVGDHLPYEVRMKKLVGRMGTYMQGYGDLLVNVNGWDPAVLQKFREDEVVANVGGAIDGVASTEQLEHIAKLIPESWMESAATGSIENCVKKIRGQFDLGCDGVILHGCSPEQLAPVVEHYRDTRPANAFPNMLNNPGAYNGNS